MPWKQWLAALALVAICCAPGEPLADGFYEILRKGSSASDVSPIGEGERLVVNDFRYIAEAEGTPPEWLVLSDRPSVPLILGDTPVGERDPEGRMLLRMRLAPDHIPTLESFTREHLGGGVAIVIGGDVVTTHKIRAVIADGRIKITRCADDACRKLLTKLAD